MAGSRGGARFEGGGRFEGIARFKWRSVTYDARPWAAEAEAEAQVVGTVQDRQCAHLVGDRHTDKLRVTIKLRGKIGRWSAPGNSVGTAAAPCTLRPATSCGAISLGSAAMMKGVPSSGKG